MTPTPIREILDKLINEKEALSLEIERLRAENRKLITENENLKAKMKEVFGYYIKGKSME